MVHYVIANLGTKGLSKSNNANENIGYPNIVCIVVGLYKDIAKKLYLGRKLEAYDGKQLGFEEILAQYAWVLDNMKFIHEILSACLVI